jgi:tetratricopeptide (TPR) repeat protein
MTGLDTVFADHLSPTQLACLIEGLDGPGSAYQTLLHLRVCDECRARLVRDYPRDGPALVHEFNLAAPQAAKAAGHLDPSDRSCLDRLWQRASDRLVREFVEAPQLLEALNRVSPAQQHLALEAQRYQTLGFAIHLLAGSSRLWNDRPAEAHRFAELALAVVSKLEPGVYPVGLVADIECKSLAYLGNSLRLMGKLSEAEEKLIGALSTWEKGTGVPRLRARVLALLSRLLRGQRRFSEALAKARESKEIYRRARDFRKASMLVLIYASILAEGGELAMAIQELRDLLASVPREVMGQLTYWSVRQNLAHRLVEADHLWEARHHLKDVKRWVRQEGTPLLSARVQWVEALLVAREGDATGAALRLKRIRDIFLDNGMPYDAALACLDLAAVYLRRGRLDDAQELAAILAPIFQGTGIHREALASLRVIAAALEAKAATAAQVDYHRHLTRQRRRQPPD